MPSYEITSPDGQVFEVTAPEGASEQEVLSYAQQNFSSLEQEPAIQEPVPQDKIGRGEAFMAGVGDMASMGFLDEAAGAAAGLTQGIGNLFGQGQEVGQALGATDDLTAQQAMTQYARGQQDVAKQEHPYAYTAGQVTGGIGASLSAPSAIAKGVTKLAGKTLPRQLATMGGVGGVSGGSYAVGSGEGGMQERLAGIPSGSGYGAIGGVAGVGAGRAIGKVAKPLTERAKKVFPAVKKAISGKPQTQALVPQEDALEKLISRQEVAPSVPDSQKAIGAVGKALKKDFGQDIDEALSLYKQGDISLAELYGKRTSALAEGAAVYPSGRAVAEQALDPKIQGSYERLLGNIRSNVSGADNYFTTVDDMVNAGRVKAAPLYKKAYETEIVQSDKLNELLMRPAGKQALIKADKIAANEGIDLKGKSNTMVLDYVKRGLMMCLTDIETRQQAA